MYTAIYMVIAMAFVSSVVSYFIGWSKGYHAKVEKIAKRNGRSHKADHGRKDPADVKFVDERGREIKTVVKMPKKARKSHWNSGKSNAKPKNSQRRPIRW